MAATIRDIATFLARPDTTEVERELVTWQYRVLLLPPGSFKDRLWDAIIRADMMNLARLRRAFPRMIEAYEQWSYGELGRQIRAKGLDV